MTQNELDRLIAMLEPQAGPDAVEFVRCELGRLLHGATPGAIDAEVNVENDRSCTSQGEVTPHSSKRTEQQRVDVYDVEEEYNPNDPRNW